MTTSDKEDLIIFESLPYTLATTNMLVTSKIGEQVSILEIYFTKPSTVTIPTITANSEDVILYIDFITS